MDYKNGTQEHELPGPDDQLPEIDALSRAANTITQSITKGRTDDLTQRMAEQARTIRELTQQLQDKQEELHDSARAQHELNSLLHAAMSTPGPGKRSTEPPGRRESPGPHRLQPKGIRQEDKDFQEKVRQQTPHVPPPNDPTDPGLVFIKTLAKAISDNHHHDLNEPIKFTGQDQQWDEFYYQLRSYLAAKNWLSTFDHPHGPGHDGFDNEINLKIYNKLTSLCHKGTAITYIRMAAEFDGWGAGRHLLARYHGFSKQRQRTLRHTIENLRHIHGTNICTHIDFFEKLCTQMTLNDPDHPPNEEQKIDWFLDTVTEKNLRVCSCNMLRRQHCRHPHVQQTCQTLYTQVFFSLPPVSDF